MSSSSYYINPIHGGTSVRIKNKICGRGCRATIRISESERYLDRLYFCCAKYNYIKWYNCIEEEKVSSERQQLV